MIFRAESIWKCLNFLCQSFENSNELFFTRVEMLEKTPGKFSQNLAHWIDDHDISIINSLILYANSESSWLNVFLVISLQSVIWNTSRASVRVSDFVCTDLQLSLLHWKILVPTPLPTVMTHYAEHIKTPSIASANETQLMISSISWFWNTEHFFKRLFEPGALEEINHISAS